MANILIHWMWTLCLAVIHPFYVSMTEIAYNQPTKSVEVSVRIFTDDFENTLRQNHPHTKIDILHPADPDQMNKLVNEYIQKRLQLQINGQPVTMSFVGYEQQTESIWTYFEVKQVSDPQKIAVFNSLLHDFTKNQINIIHIKVNKKQESTRLNFPETNASFLF